jgi:hypothetical protein
MEVALRFSATGGEVSWLSAVFPANVAREFTEIEMAWAVVADHAKHATASAQDARRMLAALISDSFKVIRGKD